MHPILRAVPVQSLAVPITGLHAVQGDADLTAGPCLMAVCSPPWAPEQAP